MELSFNDLKKREVINVADGRNLGNITDLSLVFPSGLFTGITVQGEKRSWIASLFRKSDFFIERSKIIKIGNDVILVDLKCGDVCAPNVNANYKKKQNSCSNLFNPKCNNIDNQNENGIDLGDY